jgi:DGQHR domain-containing protein
MSYPFEGPEEEKRALAWMILRLKEVSDPKAEGQAQEISDLLGELGTRLSQIDTGGAILPEDWYDDLWERFLFAVSGVWVEDAEEAWDAPLEWGDWELEEERELQLGYSQSQLLLRTLIPRGGGTSVHFYSEVPPPIHWTLTPVTQKRVTFLIGKARVSEIDAVCSVPQLPAEIEAAEAGRRILDSSRGNREWQRRIEPRRVESIKKFISGQENIIANSAILYAEESVSFLRGKYGRVKIDFKGFLRRDGSEWSDHSGKKDLRPLWLIDGQHRVRGLAQSKEGIDLEIPIILFPPEFSLAQSAKIFSEVNTLQKKLTPLHTLFMQHRFGIPSPQRKRDFREPWEPGDSKTWDSRANHLSYECAGHLTSKRGSPLEGRIKILDQNRSPAVIIQASQWVDFSRSWFLPGGMYGPDRPETQDVINTEVENYFQAIIKTCNHDGWKDGKKRWASGTKSKGLIQRAGPSQALLRLYPTVWAVAKGGRPDSPIPESRFLEALRPLTWVDWLDPGIHSTFGRSGERPRTALRIWMETAVRNGKTYHLDEVMSKDLHSLPGRGILSSPGKGTLEVVSQERWPRPDHPILLRATQPENTLTGSNWEIFDSEKVNRTPEDSVVFARGGVAELRLEYDDWMASVQHFEVRVDWHNAVGPPGGAELRLERPARA